MQNHLREVNLVIQDLLVSNRFQDLNQCRQSPGIAVISGTMHNSSSKTRLNATYSKNSPVS